MGYVKIFEMDNNGAGFDSVENLSYGDALELELAVSVFNTAQIACVICFCPIPQGTGNTCETHKGQKPNW